MPSLFARVVGYALRTTGKYRRQFSGGPAFSDFVAKSRAAGHPEPSAKIRQKLDVQRTEFAGRPVWRLTPKGAKPTAEMLYWHGGGYVYPPADAHFDYMAHMALQHGWAVTAPLYPLAPESNAQVVTDWALDYYKHYLAERAGERFVMGGDSAGGGLTASMLMLARGAGLVLPAGAILICPWLNARPNHPDQIKIEPRDAILTIRGIREAGELFADTLPIEDIRVSPIHGDWSGLPPILSFGGGDDILVTDARALKAKLPTCEYHEGAGLIHVWPIFVFAESRIAQREMAEFATIVTQHAA